MFRKSLLIVLFFVSSGLLPASAQRWTMDPAGHGIVWRVDGAVPHADHIEMSGQRMACVLRWGVGADSAFRLERSLVFPLLRTVPNNTHASLMFRLATDIPALLAIDGLALQAERVDTVAIDGGLEVRSRWYTGGHNIGAARTAAAGPAIAMTRRIFPSRELPVLCERYVVRNIARRRLTVYVPEFSQRFETDPDKGVEGSYCVRADLAGSGRYSLAPGDSLCFDAVFQAGRAGDGPLMPDVAAEYAARMDFVRRDIDAALVLETPDPVFDRLFRFAKLRAAESIILTRGGYMHAPGGESYYAAIWANDQAEYVNPFFPFLGYDIGNASAFNAFRHFARFMNPGYEPLPSSIIAEGDDVWNGAGDRGDAAMIAYGAARYALARGDRIEAEALWPLVTWCLEYCRRQLTPEGVVASDSDELEGRFPAGSANLCTSSLYYDALLSAAALVVASPFMLVTAIAIKAYDGGPVLYSQKRLTTGGRVFKVYKFRSMIVDAEKKSGATLAKKNDSRITPIGKFIRKVRIDELPQLINILKGDMSFVGPRPERPEIAQKYEKTMPEFKYRLKVKAGLTGYAQVMGKYNTTPYDKLKLDLMYIEHQSLMLDLRIFFMTVKTCFIPEATEGVKDSAPLETHRDRIEHDNSKDEKNSEEIKL